MVVSYVQFMNIVVSMNVEFTSPPRTTLAYKLLDMRVPDKSERACAVHVDLRVCSSRTISFIPHPLFSCYVLFAFIVLLEQRNTCL